MTYNPCENIVPIEPPKYKGVLDMERGVLTFYRDDKNGTLEFFKSIRELIAKGEITVEYKESTQHDD